MHKRDKLKPTNLIICNNKAEICIRAKCGKCEMVMENGDVVGKTRMTASN